MSGNTRGSNHQTYSWHSPAPYLFGGVSAMLALVAFALLILACSYWKISGRSSRPFAHNNNFIINNNNNNAGNSAADSGGSKNIQTCGEDMEEKVMVIMAGDEKPTFLAKPISATAWSDI